MILYWVVAFVVFDLLLIGYILYRRSRGRISAGLQKQIQEQWLRICKEDDPKHAILDADKLLDFALKAYGYQGSLGDKLKKAEAHFSDVNGLWRAHKIRNRIAHELEFKVDLRLYKECLRAFDRALKDLKVL